VAVFLQILLGVVGLAVGAELIVRSAINLSNIYKISGYFIGFTLVALGTSLPEFAATLQALFEAHSVDIALGNIIGSNIANILLILGVVAWIYPIVFPDMKKQNKQAQIVVGITIGIVFFFLVLAKFKIPVIVIATSGALFMCLVVMFLFIQFAQERKNSSYKENHEDTFSQSKSYVLLIIGLVLLIYGSRYFIIGAKQAAIEFGIAESIIGLTLVSFGTSLPELATGIVSAVKKQTGIAVGTILGSNIYNILGVFGVILLVRPGGFPIQEVGSIFSNPLVISIFFMAFVTMLFYWKIRFGINLKFIKFKANQLGKNSGKVFIAFYIIYTLVNYFYLN
jgi:cation:H+ antiporter